MNSPAIYSINQNIVLLLFSFLSVYHIYPDISLIIFSLKIRGINSKYKCIKLKVFLKIFKKTGKAP